MRSVFAVVAAAALTGCGYVGDPLPPALNIPEKIQDLQAVQRGDEIHIAFTLPLMTTDGLPIRRLQGIDLRIGTTEPPFDFDRWSTSASPVPVEQATGVVTTVTPARPWYGRNAVVAVRLVGSSGRVSEWSNPASVDVLQPLPMPAGVQATPHPNGVRVQWQAPPRDQQRFRIFRKGEADKEAALITTSEGSEFIDTTAVLGKRYEYTVQSFAGNSESDVSKPVTVVARDDFPPAVPTGLTGVSSVNSIELNWERGSEPDLASYRVYRSEGDGQPARVADAVPTPAFSDKQVTAGTTYRYSVTAVDQAGNESAKSAPVQVVAP